MSGPKKGLPNIFASEAGSGGLDLSGFEPQRKPADREAAMITRQVAKEQWTTPRAAKPSAEAPAPVSGAKATSRLDPSAKPKRRGGIIRISDVVKTDAPASQKVQMNANITTSDFLRLTALEKASRAKRAELLTIAFDLLEELGDDELQRRLRALAG